MILLVNPVATRSRNRPLPLDVLVTDTVRNGFEIIVGSRWPTIHEMHAPQWGRVFLNSLSSWRYALVIYQFRFEFQRANKFINLRKPKRESL
jgi:anaerobic magnesium-protoporphyrin IX monomethyl ester cyclase